jgi:hypothetical protein
VINAVGRLLKCVQDEDRIAELLLDIEYAQAESYDLGIK